MSEPAVDTWAFTAPLWRENAWHFLTVPESVSDEVDAVVGDSVGGFGAVRVEVSVGSSTWRTSLFPSSQVGAYVLPVKKAVRTANDLQDGDVAEVVVRIVER